MRVLVVEDEALLSRQLATALGEAGYAVDCAEDGEKADFMGQTEGYDAVVLDLGLPKVDGLTLLKRWREQGSPCPWSSSPPGAPGTRRSRASTAAPTTTCRSRSEWRSCSRGCAP